MVKKLAIVCGVICIPLISVLSLFHPGLHPTHDGEYHIIRFYEFYKVLETGVFYPRIAPDLNFGFGAPLFNFVYPLPNYIAALLHFFGLSFIDAFKASMILATILGSIGMYLWSKGYWGRLGGVVSAVVYSFAPYRLLDIFIRGSVGEIWALAIFPWLLWSFRNQCVRQDLRFVPITAVFLALIFFSLENNKE